MCPPVLRLWLQASFNELACQNNVMRFLSDSILADTVSHLSQPNSQRVLEIAQFSLASTLEASKGAVCKHLQ